MYHPLLGEIPTSKYGALLYNIIGSADLFYASSPMVDLARVAAQSLPPIGLDRHDAPSRCGLIFFETPPCAVSHGDPPLNYPVSGIAWFEVNDRGHHGLLVERLVIRDAMTELVFNAGLISARDVEYSRSVMPRLVWMPEGASWIPYGAKEADCHSQRFRELNQIVRSSWLLMQQPVTTISEAEYTRADRRRLARRDIPADRVRVIQLRRRTHSTEHGESDREYHHRWIVRGHWRQQWYPARGVHRPVWIAPHLKGPDGAPLLGGEKVHAWTR
jgi:hypothetical protein